jgi:hypothetical protein
MSDLCGRTRFMKIKTNHFGTVHIDNTHTWCNEHQIQLNGSKKKTPVWLTVDQGFEESEIPLLQKVLNGIDELNVASRNHLSKAWEQKDESVMSFMQDHFGDGLDVKLNPESSLSYLLFKKPRAEVSNQDILNRLTLQSLMLHCGEEVNEMQVSATFGFGEDISEAVLELNGNESLVFSSIQLTES